MAKKKSALPPSFATKGYGSNHFTPFYDDQLQSPAFIALSAVAVRVYIILRMEYKGDYTGNKVICPYDTIVEKGVSRNSISKAIRMLEVLGFITCDRGGLGHQPTTYRFSNDWAKIESKEEAEGKLTELDDVIAEEKRRRLIARGKFIKESSA